MACKLPLAQTLSSMLNKARPADYSTFRFLSDWFVERRGFANGVCFAGTALLPFFICQP